MLERVISVKPQMCAFRALQWNGLGRKGPAVTVTTEWTLSMCLRQLGDSKRRWRRVGVLLCCGAMGVCNRLASRAAMRVPNRSNRASPVGDKRSSSEGISMSMGPVHC